MEKYPLTYRKNEALRILNKYPNKIPIIIEKYKNCKDIPDIDKNRYLVPEDLTIAQFLYVIRRRLKLKPEQSLFIFFKNDLQPSSALIKEVYERYKNDDYFLYVTYTSENTYG